MNYLGLLTEHNLALLSDWLSEASELYVDIERPHSGSSGDCCFVRSMRDLKALVAEEKHPELVLTIYRHIQYPLRGVANADLLDKALQYIRGGLWYTILAQDDYYPSKCSSIGGGNSHIELRQDFSNLAGQNVKIGLDPRDYSDQELGQLRQDLANVVLRKTGQEQDVPGISNELLHTLRHEEVFRISVTKNQNYYEGFAEHPDKYRSVIDLWHE